AHREACHVAETGGAKVRHLLPRSSASRIPLIQGRSARGQHDAIRCPGEEFGAPWDLREHRHTTPPDVELLERGTGYGVALHEADRHATPDPLQCPAGAFAEHLAAVSRDTAI